jgi:HSP20 family protein
MALVRWDPARELDLFQGEVGRLFDAFFGVGGNGHGARRWVPAMDLVETEDALLVKADLPGLERDDVSIEIEDGVLTISGERKAEHSERRDGYVRVERGYGSFARSLRLPEGVDAEQVKASFANGVLEVRIPKPEERKPHRVEITSGALEGEASER